MDFPRINYETRQSIVNCFDSIAKQLFSNCILQINDAHYRLTNIEFYCFTKSEIFQDPYTHKNNLQLSSGKLYLHGSGIDLTCGDGENHCSILIRGIAKIHDGATQETAFIKYQIDGPHKVATELFGNINYLCESVANKITLLDIKGHNQDSLFCLPKHILKAKRVGLSGKSDYFKNLPLRYLLFTPAFKMKYAGITEIVMHNLKSGNINKQEAVDIVGYNLNLK